MELVLRCLVPVMWFYTYTMHDRALLLGVATYLYFTKSISVGVAYGHVPVWVPGLCLGPWNSDIPLYCLWLCFVLHKWSLRLFSHWFIYKVIPASKLWIHRLDHCTVQYFCSNLKSKISETSTQCICPQRRSIVCSTLFFLWLATMTDDLVQNNNI